MPRHGENIFKRKDGRWEGRYISSYNEYGKAIYKSVYSKTYSEVSRKLEISKSNNSNLQKSNTINTFGDLLYYWFEFNSPKNKQTTQDKYEFLIEKHIAPELGKVKLNKISSAMINKFIDSKIKILSNSYVRTMAIIVKSALELGIKERFIFMPNSDIHLPKQTKHELQILSSAEQSLLEQYILNNIDFTTLGIYISLYAGLRIGEICALRWSDIDFENRIIKVRSTVIRVKGANGKSYDEIGPAKTDASIRDIPIYNKLFIPLLKMRKLSNSPYVISDKMNFVKKRTFEYRYHKILKNAGIRDTNYHALRHSFATRCIECGVDVKSLSEFMGHSNVSVTLNTYVHSSMDLKKIQIEKLNNGTVEFTAYDYAENNTYRDDTKRVIVDNISPTSTITFNEPVQNANNVSYYAGNIDATISINEANFYSQDVEVIVTKDGSRYPVSVNWTDNSVDSHSGTFRLTEDGDYVVRVVYSDRSGNAMATYESNQLTIDTVDPVITVTGLNHQSANNGETIGFSISVTDKNIALSEFKPVLTAVIRNDNGELETITISLGDPVTSTNDRGETVYTYTVQNLSVDGFYSLTCSAVDYANHSVNLINSGQDNGTSSNEEAMNFSVNREGSTFWIETTHNDKYSSKTFTNELDKAYANDNIEIVVHELNVDQVNISNNSDEETVFALHDGTSTGYVTLQEGSGSNGNYVKNTLRGEGGWYETRYTLSNDNFAHDGIYSFSILSYDRAGNSNLNTKDDAGVIKFTVDRTNPVITSNISTDQVIDADSHTVEFEINDTNHDKNTVEVTLNGKPVSNESITSLGGNSYSFEMSTGSKQSVSVTSKDLAGNTADQYEINDVTVSTNQFVLFYYSHTLLFWIIVAGIVLLALLILFIVFRRKKDDEDEEKA